MNQLSIFLRQRIEETTPFFLVNAVVSESAVCPATTTHHPIDHFKIKKLIRKREKYGIGSFHLANILNSGRYSIETVQSLGNGGFWSKGLGM